MNLSANRARQQATGEVSGAFIVEAPTKRLTARLPWFVRLGVVAVIGLAVAQYVPAIIHDAWAGQMKLRGRATICPWDRIASYYSDQKDFSDRLAATNAKTVPAEQDKVFGIRLVSSPERSFWMKDPIDVDGLAYLLAEHSWFEAQVKDAKVRPGEIVLDCGAHVGVFTHHALKNGAAKVVAIEPDPTNLECLRRNFKDEIASGRVIVFPQGVWSHPDTLTFFLGDTPAVNSVVAAPQQGFSGETTQIEVTTVDLIIQTLNLERVDYIKMDIEGAEREALRGAMNTLRQYRPRLFLDSYHRRDDMDVLPGIIRQAYADYSLECGPCEPIFGEHDLLVPHVTYYK